MKLTPGRLALIYNLCILYAIIAISVGVGLEFGVYWGIMISGALMYLSVMISLRMQLNVRNP